MTIMITEVTVSVLLMKFQNAMEFNDRTTSLKTNACIRLWADADCTGTSIEIKSPGTAHVGDEFNDKLSSVSGCSYNPKELSENVDITLHLDGAEDLREHGEKMVTLMRQWFPFIQSNLWSPAYNPVRQIDLYFDREDHGIYASGREVHVYSGYVRNNKGDTGVYIHEMTHVIHQARGCPGWVVEGMAEYMRRWFYEPLSETKKVTMDDEDNDYRGYWLLHYLNTATGKPIVYTLNKACQEGTWRDNLLEDLTGKTKEEWYKQMVNDNRFPWKRV